MRQAAFSCAAATFSHTIDGMGFATIATATASLLPKVLEAHALSQQSNMLNKAADEQEKLAGRQAASIANTAMENQRREARNAQNQIAQARVDAAASNLAEDGSAYKRELDLATRLQDEITHNANATLQQANTLQQQAAYNAWDTRNAAKRSKMQAWGSAASGVGSLFSSLAGGLNGGNKRQKRP